MGSYLPGAVLGGKVMEDDLSEALSHQWWGSSKQEAWAGHTRNVALVPPGSWWGKTQMGFIFVYEAATKWTDDIPIRKGL